MSALTVLSALRTDTLPGQGLTISTGETILFWCCAAIIGGCALGVVFFSRKAVYTAVFMMFIMLTLAALYTAQGAEFMAMAQVVVYTGAIMMLFLFVIMLVGRNASDETKSRRTPMRVVALVIGILLGAILTVVLLNTAFGSGVGLGEANAETNPVAVAKLIFSKHVFAMELAGILLVISAVGALTLAHRERLAPARGQEKTATDKMAAYAAQGAAIGQLPAPGVYAESTAADIPAISAQGVAVEDSVPRVIRARGLARSVGEASLTTAHSLTAERYGDKEKGLHGADASRSVPLAAGLGMPGQAGPPPARQLQPEVGADENPLPESEDQQ